MEGRGTKKDKTRFKNKRDEYPYKCRETGILEYRDVRETSVGETRCRNNERIPLVFLKGFAK